MLIHIRMWMLVHTQARMLTRPGAGADTRRAEAETRPEAKSVVYIHYALRWRMIHALRRRMIHALICEAENDTRPETEDSNSRMLFFCAILF